MLWSNPHYMSTIGTKLSKHPAVLQKRENSHQDIELERRTHFVLFGQVNWLKRHHFSEERETGTEQQCVCSPATPRVLQTAPKPKLHPELQYRPPTSRGQVVLHLQHHTLAHVLQQADDLVVPQFGQVNAIHRLYVVPHVQLVTPERQPRGRKSGWQRQEVRAAGTA